MAAYTITSPTDGLTNATFASLGIVSHGFDKFNQAPDVVTLRQTPSSWTNDAILSYEAQVTIKRDDTVIFVGTCVTDPRTAVAAVHGISYTLLGPWYWLDEIEYRQSHKRWNGATIADVWLSKVVLCQSTAGARLHSGEQIEDAIDYCIAQGAPIARGTIEPAVQIPWEQTGPIKTSEVIRRMLKWSPDAVAWWNYNPETGHPVLNVTARSSMSATSVDLANYRSTRANVRPLYKLQRPGVEIIYERTTTVGSATYMTTESDTAGDHTNKAALRATIDLAGGADGSAQYQKIKTSDVPSSGDPAATDWTLKAWWKARVPALAAYADADLSIHDPIVTVEDDLYPIAQLPRILEEGQITPWMEDGGVKAAHVTLSVQINSIERDGAGGLVKSVENRVHTLTFTGTDASTRTYSRMEFGSYQETVPSGIAAALYASLSILPYDGAITFIGEDPDLSYHPGQKFNILSGRAAWATMDAVIQRASFNTADGSTTITFGAARHLGPEDIVALLKRIRHRNHVTAHVARNTAAAGDSGSIGGGRAPRNDAAAEGGEPKRTVHRRYPPTGAYTAEIDTDEAAIVKTNESDTTAISIKPREILIPQDDGAGNREYRMRQVMASAAYGDPVDLAHDHDSDYAPIDHNHDGDYAAALTDEVIYDHDGSYETCKPMTGAGKYWTLVQVAIEGDTYDGHTVPAGKRQFFMQQFCLPLYDQPGYCLYSTPEGQYLNFIDADGDTQTQSVADGVMGSYTGIIKGTDPATGDPVTATLTSGICTDYEGQIALTNDTTGETVLLRIDSDGKIKQ